MRVRLHSYGTWWFNYVALICSPHSRPGLRSGVKGNIRVLSDDTIWTLLLYEVETERKRERERESEREREREWVREWVRRGEICLLNSLPGRDIASLLHEGTQGEPKTVLDGEVVGEQVFGRIDASRHRRRVCLLQWPFSGAKATNHEQDDAHPQIGECHAHPHLLGQRVHETEHARQFLDWFLDHDADAEVHERFGEIHNAFTGRDDCDCSDRYIRFLVHRNPYQSSASLFFSSPYFFFLHDMCPDFEFYEAWSPVIIWINHDESIWLSSIVSYCETSLGVYRSLFSTLC